MGCNIGMTCRFSKITINGDDDYAEYELCIECDIPVVFYRIAEARGAKIYNEYKNAQ